MRKMNQEYNANPIIEALMISAPAAILSALGFVGHTMAYAAKIQHPRRIVGGLVFACFVGYVAAMILHQTGMHSYLCDGIASVIGASGDRGFELLFSLIKRQMGDKS